MSQQEKLGRTIAGNSIKNYIVLQRGDFAYNKSATKAYPEGYIARYSGPDRAAVPNSIFTCFRVDERLVEPDYLDYLFASNLHGRWLRKYIAVGARAHGSLNVNDDDLLGIPVPLPGGAAQPQEQRKIADCLTSLDDAIAAQAQKVEALKAHKRGLMQQLFPREGESVPQLRFREFRKARAWETSTLGAIATILKGKGVAKSDVTPDGSLPCIRYGELYTRYGEVIDVVHSRTNAQASELFLSRQHDILIPASGETKLDIATAACVLHDGVALGSDLNVLRTNQNGVFLSYLLTNSKRKEIARVAQGDTVVHLYPSQLQKIVVSLPDRPEQQEIAACLTSLDAVMATQAAKVEALKVHKRGLLQQLFPYPSAD